MNSKFIKDENEVEEVKEVTEEKEKVVEEKKSFKLPKLPLYVYVVIGVVVSIFVLIIALVVASSGSEEVPETPVKQEEVIEDGKELTDASVKKIYEEALPFVGHYVYEMNTYGTEKITFDNADKGYLRAFAFQNIDFKEEDVSPILDEAGNPVLEFCDEDCGDWTYEDLVNSAGFMFNADVLQESAKKLYGREIAHGNFNVYLEAGGTYKDGQYEYICQGGSDHLSHHYREYVSFQLGEDTLYVYDKYLYIYGELDSRHEHYNVEVYADSAKKKLLGKATYLEADNLVDFIVPTYERKKANYRHEFKKAEDGHWYWISSEPLK